MGQGLFDSGTLTCKILSFKSDSNSVGRALALQAKSRGFESLLSLKVGIYEELNVIGQLREAVHNLPL